MALASNDWEDGFTYTGATGSTVGPFSLLGGLYAFFGTAAGTSTALQILMPDGSFVTVQAETTSAYYTTVSLPPGRYQIVVVSAAAQAGGLVRVPYRAA